MPNRSVSNTASQESWLQISKVAIKLQCRCMLLNSICNASWWFEEAYSSSGGLSWSSGTPLLQYGYRTDLMSRWQQTRAIALPQPQNWYHKLNARCSNLVTDDGFALNRKLILHMRLSEFSCAHATAPNKSMIPSEQVNKLPSPQKNPPEQLKDAHRPLQSPDSHAEIKSWSRKSSQLVVPCSTLPCILASYPWKLSFTVHQAPPATWPTVLRDSLTTG